MTGFRPANAWYLNDDANIAYAGEAPNGGQLGHPVLFVNGTSDALCDTGQSRIGEPMRQACADLSLTEQAGGHWLPLERKIELVDDIRRWADAKLLS